MLDVTLLGRGGMIPLPDRFLTSLYLRYLGCGILIDCGEATQVAIRVAGLGFKAIDIICLTHFHADHIAGLPGLLLTIGNSGKETPLTIVGPKYVAQVVESLRIIAPQLPYDIHYLELPEAGGDILSVADLQLSAHPVEHWIPCYAYRFILPRQGRFLPDRAKQLNIPPRHWSQLQKGDTVTLDGHTFTPDQVMGPPRQGLKLVYSTDLRPSDSLARFADGADLFICEGIYGDPEAKEKAIQHKHCLFSEAATMAAMAKVQELWLTHFSPSLTKPEDFLAGARAIFPATFIDKPSMTLTFRDA